MINFKTMTALSVLATLACGEKTFAMDTDKDKKTSSSKSAPTPNNAKKKPIVTPANDSGSTAPKSVPAPKSIFDIFENESSSATDDVNDGLTSSQHLPSSKIDPALSDLWDVNFSKLPSKPVSVFEQYASTQKDILKEELSRSKLLEATALSEEEKELELLEQQIAQKKNAIALKKKNDLDNAFDVAVTAAKDLDTTLGDMMGEVNKVWVNALNALSYVTEVVEKSDEAASELQARAKSANKEAQALEILNGEKRNSILAQAAKSKAFLTQHRDFLEDPVNVPYKGQQMADLAAAASRFCTAERMLPEIHEAYSAAESDLQNAREARDALSARVDEKTESVSALSQRMTELASQKATLAERETELRDVMAQLEAPQSQEASISEQLQALRSQLNEAEGATGEPANRRDSLQSRLPDMRGELEDLQRRQGELNQSEQPVPEEMTNRISELTAQLETTQADITKATTDLETALSTYRQLRDAVHSLEQQEQEGKMTELANRRDVLGTQIGSLKESTSSLQAIIGGLEVEGATLETTENELASLRGLFANAEQEATRLSNLFEEKSQLLATQKEELTQARQHLFEANSKFTN